MAGYAPQSAADINNQVGSLLRQFSSIRDQVFRYQRVLAGLDLKATPFNMTAGDEADLKSSINTLNTDLQAFDMTFSNRLTGLF